MRSYDLRGVTRSLSREAAIGIGVAALAVAAMAVDHLIGTESEPGEEGGLADPAAFAISSAVSVGLVVLLFGVVVRRAAREDPVRSGRKALVTSALAVPSVALMFLGVPFAVAGAGVALGLIAREGPRRGLGTVAVVLGALVISVAVVGYAVALVT